MIPISLIIANNKLLATTAWVYNTYDETLESRPDWMAKRASKIKEE